MKLDIVRDRKFYRMIAALAVPIMMQDLLRISVDTFNSILLDRKSTRLNSSHP